MIQLTGMIFEGVPEKYPSWHRLHGSRLLLAPVLDGPHGRGVVEAQGRGPALPEEAERLLDPGSSSSAEGDEKSVPEVIRRLGNDIIFYASDVPHWDHDFPENIRELATRQDLSAESKRKILYENTRRLYELTPVESISSGR
jgi:hypothetical protein